MLERNGRKERKKDMKNLRKIEGITLIALVITIIVLLILAGVSIAMLTGNNGILTQTQNAKKMTEVANEKEAVQLAIVSKEITDDEKYNVGKNLYDKTLENGDKWRIISFNNTIYGTGWTYIPKETEVENYGKTKSNWLINYEKGETIELEEGKFTELAYGENLAVKDGLILNADPINMSDANSWGNGVTIHGVQEGDGFGWNKTEFKFDGINDYIEVNTDVNLEEGMTFEFYGKSDSSAVYMLSKTLKNDNRFAARFRTYFKGDKSFWCCMSSKNSQSSWVVNPQGLSHWIQKSNVGSFSTENGSYLTMTVNLKTDMISLYWNGEFVGNTQCNHEWLVSGDLTNSNVPFTIGMMVSGDVYAESFSKMDLYACRLYNKALSDQEVKDNTNATIAYHNLLVQENNKR